MKKKIFFLVFSFLLISTFVYATGDQMPPQPKLSAEFERMKALVGTWEGSSTEPDGRTNPAKAEYSLSSAGSVLVEKLFAGTPNEMTSIYHDTNGKFGMTHYCAIGNHPELALQGVSGNVYEFALAPVNSIAEGEPHMHDLKVEFKDVDTIVQTWTYYVGGQPQGSTMIQLKRAK